MFDQIEPRTLNSVQLTDAAIKPNCTANITALLLPAIEPIIDLSPTRKKLSDETKQQKKNKNDKLCLSLHVLSRVWSRRTVSLCPARPGKIKKASYFLAHLHSVLL